MLLLPEHAEVSPEEARSRSIATIASALVSHAGEDSRQQTADTTLCCFKAGVARVVVEAAGRGWTQACLSGCW